MFNLANVKSQYKIQPSKVAFGEADEGYRHSRLNQNEKSNVYKDMRVQLIKDKYYNKYKALYQMAEDGNIDNNMFWIMKKRLESQKQAELEELERELLSF